ncbi:bifunctional adenosylcobinamide kinase/adenosylcobinamide-phosphate guanylyltransferase [uncultured Megasphaera sp.]|uniref:bifunctional adenosylcobinamide kinase/adenosylcobinamide-phosphate guanylyltransferase n=1 Tax=uncultured Megasphaera sp. TaxID=165188 RepID=UPI002597F749|nr:bifunctional adenosylcobinamide kinase/adenosylcobinamide-phosphate guanylyltransferase [uncultured Megasphaera sp.]
MKSKLIVVTGGARSGKSLFAEEYLTSCSGRKAYVATAQILDEEMKERVAEHRRRRPEDWQTLEISSGLSAAFPAVLEQADAVLVDCLTLYLSNYLFAHETAGDEEILQGALQEMENIVGAVRQTEDKTVIFVTNELGCGIVPMSRISRLYRDVVGKVNQYAAGQADEVYWTVCGIPVEITRLRASVPPGGCR